MGISHSFDFLYLAILFVRIKELKTINQYQTPPSYDSPDLPLKDPFSQIKGEHKSVDLVLSSYEDQEEEEE